ncbi:Signal transduction histidine kinase [Flexibacter flexilis DSM 6793]|uniref:histidine kinase n=1 Tax=Flexibacter flexilis DSM 6793 TaxID=927664 RepID=A0A1I1DHI0_9BACT|nr:tetratricopeptide repeat-containing sensor histidine kinase [Flexibacter flexilis]SFB71993.1 Signal transduction histidine kinase [Flexibacter flexilis DSM 6793]
MILGTRQSLSIRFYFLIIFCVIQPSAWGQDLAQWQAQLRQPNIPDSVKAQTLRSIAISFMGNNYDSAGVYAERLARLAQQKNKPQWQGNALNIKALIASNTGNYPKAMHTFQLASKAFEKAADERGQGVVLSNVANIYYIQQNYDKARNYYELALEHYKKIPHSSSNIARTLNGLANVWHGLKQYDNALKVQQDAIVLFIDSTQDHGGLAYGYNNVAEIYLTQHHLEKAFASFQSAEKEATIVDDKRAISFAWQGMAKVKLAQKQYVQAASYGQKAWELVKEINATSEMNMAAHTLQLIYEAMKDYKRAYYFSVLHKQFSDSLLNEQIHKQSLFIDADFQYRLKEKKLVQEHATQNQAIQHQLNKRELILWLTIPSLILVSGLLYWLYRSSRKYNLLHKTLSLQNEQMIQQKELLAQKTKELTQTNNIKDRLFYLIAHDLNTPVQTMIKILDSCKSNMTDEERGELIGRMYLHVNHTAYSIKNMLAWAKGQQQAEYKMYIRLEINKLIADAVANVEPQAAKKNVEILYSNLSPTTVVANEELTVLLLQNLIYNALKHTPAGQRVKIRHEKQGNFCQVLIQDSGEGLLENQIDKLFDKEYYAQQTRLGQKTVSGLGLILCKDFAQTNGGTISAQNAPDGGFVIAFTLPLA